MTKYEREEKAKPSAKDVRQAMLEVGDEYSCELSFEVLPTVGTKEGHLYIRLYVKDCEYGALLTPCPWRGAHFPNADSTTITATMYGLVLGMEGDLERQRAARIKAQPVPMFAEEAPF